jgi:hypothetical protein
MDRDASSAPDTALIDRSFAHTSALCHTADESIPRMPLRPLTNAIAFSSLLVATVGFALTSVASLVLVSPQPLHWSLLSGLGTFIIYNLDRLRDTTRDRDTSPGRTAFIEAHRDQLTYAVALAAVAFGGLLMRAPRGIGALCIGIGLVGLLHRRIKRAAAIKAVYVSLAWVAACVGIPWLAAGRPLAGFWLGAIMLPILSANLIASNLRDNEIQVLPTRPDLALRFARALTLLALVIALIAPARFAAVGWIAAAQGLALVGFREGERYGLLVVDGALLAGSLIALLHLTMLD